MANARIIYKEYFRCSTQDDAIAGLFGAEIKLIATAITFNGRRLSDGTFTTVPAWFAQVNGYPVYDTYWVMTPPAESNTSYEFSWTVTDKGGVDTDYIVRLNMLDFCSLSLGCATGTDRKPLSVLLWLTREGGWQYFPFNGRKSFKVTIPEAGTYKQSDYVLRNHSRDGVFEGETLTAREVEVQALDLLASLKQSIQVYYVEDFLNDGEQVYKPVIIQDRDFAKRKSGEKVWDVSVNFIYATEQVIQSQ